MASSNVVGTLIYDQTRTATDTGDAGKQFNLSDASNPLTFVQIKIAADAAVTSTVSVSIQGRLDPNGAWNTLTKSDYSTAATVAQVAGAAVDSIIPVTRMPYMRITHAGGSGGYAASVGNRIRVWVLGAGKSLSVAS